MMEDDKKIEAAAEAVGQKTRRAFVKTAAQVAVTAPAVAMLLSASMKKAAAAEPYAGPGTSTIPGLGDDFAFGLGDDSSDDFGPPTPGDDFFIP